jgi:hypothetical protein
MVMMQGERYVPGAAGALASNPLMDPRFKIPGGQPWNKTPLLPGNDTKKFEERPLTRPFQLPSAMNGIGVGNMGGLIAQANPDAAALGGLMQVGGVDPGSMVQPEMQNAQNKFFARPYVNYLDDEQGGLVFGGNVNVPLGQQRLRLQGEYQTEGNRIQGGGYIGQPKGVGPGIDFTVNRGLGRRGETDFSVFGRLGKKFQ